MSGTSRGQGGRNSGSDISSIARERRALRSTSNEADDEAALLRHQEEFMKTKQSPSARMIRANPTHNTTTPSISNTGPRDRVQLGDIPSSSSSSGGGGGRGAPRVSRFKQQMAVNKVSTSTLPSTNNDGVAVSPPAATTTNSNRRATTISDDNGELDDDHTTKDEQYSSTNAAPAAGATATDAIDQQQEGMLRSVIYERDVGDAKILAPSLPTFSNHGFPIAANRTNVLPPQRLAPVTTTSSSSSSPLPLPSSSVRPTKTSGNGGKQSLFARARAAERAGDRIAATPTTTTGTGLLQSKIDLVSANPPTFAATSTASKATISGTSSTRSNEASQINEENEKRIAGMSLDNIRAAQAELHSILSPHLIDVLRSGRHKTAPAKGAAAAIAALAPSSSSPSPPPSSSRASSTISQPVAVTVTPAVSSSTVATKDKEAAQIDEENAKVLAGMSLDDIKRAQAELHATFPAHLLDVIRTRRHKTAPAKGAAAALAALQTGSAAIAASHLRGAVPSSVPSTSTSPISMDTKVVATTKAPTDAASNNVSTGTYTTASGWIPPERAAPPTVKSSSTSAPVTTGTMATSTDGTSTASLLSVEDREEWMKSSDEKAPLSSAAQRAIELKKKTAAESERIWGEWRVDFNAIPIDHQTSLILPTHLGLHHHGHEPDRAGYTMRELLHLTRSTVASQRSMALRTLSHVFSRIRNGWYHGRPLPGQAPSIPLSSSMSYSQSLMIYLLSLGAPTLLRLAIDDHHITSLITSLHALSSLLTIDDDNKCISITNDANVIDALLWRGHELVNTGPVLGSDQLPQQSPDQVEDSKLHEQWCNIDMISGLLRMQILQRLRYILDVLVNPVSPTPVSWSILDPILNILIAIARHSQSAALMIADTPNLLSLISALCTTSFTGVGDTSSNTSSSSTSTPSPSSNAVVDTRCLTLVRLLCQSHRRIVTQFHSNGLLAQIKRYIILANGLPQSGGGSGVATRAPSSLGLRLSIESLVIWRGTSASPLTSIVSSCSV
jgi:hypothetical protein